MSEERHTGENGNINGKPPKEGYVCRWCPLLIWGIELNLKKQKGLVYCNPATKSVHDKEFAARMTARRQTNIVDSYEGEQIRARRNREIR